MHKKILAITILFAFLIVLAWTVMPVAASPQQPQAYYYTPTAGPNGRIIYTVKAGDSCTSVSLLTGVPLDELRLLNNLDSDCLLAEGQELLLGIYQEMTPTPGEILTPTPILALATPFTGNVEVCVYLYEDLNGNALAEENELPLANGVVSLANFFGTISRTGNTTDSTDPLCFSDVPEGEYNVSVAIPEGYNATTIVNYPLTVKPGDKAILDFGAQPKGESQTDISETNGADENSSLLMAILGVTMVLSGIGLGFYVRKLNRS